MEFSNVIKERYSVRKYKPDMIWDDELNRILEAGMLAPTGAIISLRGYSNRRQIGSDRLL